MSYILTQSADNSPFAIVRVSATSVDHPDTISNAPWLSYNSSTDTISVTDTDAYFECAMSVYRASSPAGIITYNIEPNNSSTETHTWALLLVAGATPGAGSYGRGDDVAYSVHNTAKLDYEFRNAAAGYTYITERSKSIVKRL